jgi:predicted DNA-binding transcriptional regulator AlpA
MTRLLDWQNRKLKVTEVATIYGVSVPTVWRWAKIGALPKPQKLGMNTTRWDGAEVAQHFNGVKS